MKTIRYFIHNLSDFFRDDKGNMSMTRLMGFIIVIEGLRYAFEHSDYIGGSVLVTLGLGGKIVQKRLSETDNRVFK